MKEGKHEEAFQKFAERATDEFDTVEKVFLFGSVARGDAGARSDVDIVIVVSDLSEQREIENIAFDIGSDRGVSITPIVKESLEDSRLEKEIEREGVEYVRG